MATAQPTRIALVAEGPTDQAVLTHFLGAYFEDPNIIIHSLQPRSKVLGGWTEVLRYIASPEFAAAFADNDLIVVQIDTDVCEERGFDVPGHDVGGDILTPDALAERVQARLTAQFSPDVFEKHAHQILFAICVHSIECWLLPLVYSDSRQGSTGKCGDLIPELSARTRKKTRSYEHLLRKYNCNERNVLAAIADKNPSLTRFIGQLDARFPAHAMLASSSP